MTTSIDRKALDRAKGLINTVSGAMRNVSASLAGSARAEEFNAQHDATLLEVNMPEISTALEDSFTYLAESWEDIQEGYHSLERHTNLNLFLENTLGEK